MTLFDIIIPCGTGSGTSAWGAWALAWAFFWGAQNTCDLATDLGYGESHTTVQYRSLVHCAPLRRYEYLRA